MLLKDVQMQRVNWENSGDRSIQTTWAGGQSKHSKTTQRTKQNLTKISVGKREHEKLPVTEMARDILTSVAKCRGSWVVGRGRGSWVWVWVNVVGKKGIEKK